MRRLIYLLPLLLFVGVGVAFLRGFDRDPRDIPSALIDKPAPEFSLPPLPGYKEGLSNATLKGDVTLVNVFASWCIPCKAEHPIITRLAREQGVTVRGINHKDKAEDAIAWLNRNGDPYASIGVDLDGRVSIDWGVYGVPETFLLDRQGRIRFKHVGPLTPQVVEEQILPMVKHLRSAS
ncbi:thiol:disulfide oxidoreductase DsbE [Azospirillum argentinense]|uniref:Cytochrome c biogenesis protein CcmG/thiol:disulfide interchange protein DsbE n=2 Tax=Azospirillum TaxID=191 RepID=A0A560CI02_AZOBR|nr:MULTISPECIES: DsbE family thiol:disulfide interchange protein [Azospirillum]AIB10528.1 thiol:disulfide oxidoreductase DsbE [Azospirillum argentinense]EZQ07517.1 thiol:disulfide oxidoreductase DsbE [Azospirillum argentinense]KAA1055773.1 Cytochrome c-type biogenesis protein CcmG/DsbE, thiol:disulfide oxidoreductase [Azospirillum argentinense]MBK3775104.1 DsbE family thiol:disulfide interchange protein [Azospirillum brasilense]MBK3799201.1 DsbE family thiol:disulfide interchange protein [Azos